MVKLSFFTSSSSLNVNRVEEEEEVDGKCQFDWIRVNGAASRRTNERRLFFLARFCSARFSIEFKNNHLRPFDHSRSVRRRHCFAIHILWRSYMHTHIHYSITIQMFAIVCLHRNRNNGIRHAWRELHYISCQEQKKDVVKLLLAASLWSTRFIISSRVRTHTHTEDLWPFNSCTHTHTHSGQLSGRIQERALANTYSHAFVIVVPAIAKYPRPIHTSGRRVSWKMLKCQRVLCT